MTDETEWSDWIAHKPGDECPIADGVWDYEVQLRYGDRFSCEPDGGRPAKDRWEWGEYPEYPAKECEVIAYRILKEKS